MSKEQWKIVGDRIKAIRLAKGFKKQAPYARLLGVEPPTYNMWERGNANMPVAGAISICSLTGASLDYIYRGDLSNMPAAIVQKLVTDDLPDDE